MSLLSLPPATTPALTCCTSLPCAILWRTQLVGVEAERLTQSGVTLQPAQPSLNSCLHPCPGLPTPASTYLPPISPAVLLLLEHSPTPQETLSPSQQGWNQLLYFNGAQTVKQMKNIMSILLSMYSCNPVTITEAYCRLCTPSFISISPLFLCLFRSLPVFLTTTRFIQRRWN